MHGQALVVTCLLAIATAGCIGDDIETIPLFLDAYALDTDKDGKREVVLDLFFGNGNDYGIRVDASGTMAIERARAPGDDYSPFAKTPMEVKGDSLRWKDTQQGLLYRHIVSDHHFDPGYTYRFTIDLTGDDGTPYKATKEVHYDE